MRIDPTRVPHLRTADSKSVIPDGMRVGLVPKQASLSVQDVRDYSTPEGAAMANEEMRRLRFAVNNLTEKVETVTPVDEKKDEVIVPVVEDNNVITPEDPVEPIPVEPFEYTVYHNSIPVQTVGKNISTNYIDFDGDKTKYIHPVVFEVSALRGGKENAMVQAWVAKDGFYMERFKLETLVVPQRADLLGGGQKIGQYYSKEIKHNLNSEKVVHSIYQLSNINVRVHVKVIDNNTLLVTGRLVMDYSTSVHGYRNTVLHENGDVGEISTKGDECELVIVVEGE